MDTDSGEPDKLFNRSSLPQGIGAEPAKISPVQWDNLPKPSPGISRVATQAPGSSEKGSGLVDLSALRDELAKSKGSEPAAKAPAPKPAAKAPARLAVAAKAGGNSGLIDVAALKEALDQQEAEAESNAAAKAKAAAATGDAASEVPSFGGQDVDIGDGEAAVATSGSSKMLYMIVGLLVVVAGMLGYLATT